jgi:beta-mannosidase
MTDRVRLVGTGLPAGAVSGMRTAELIEGWELVASEPGACATPEEAAVLTGWKPAVVPGTVALSVGPDDLDRHASYDASDWWYRCVLPHEVFAGETGARHRLRFDGLATLAEVWLNGQRVLESADMFSGYEVDVTDLLTGENELVIVFRSLDAALSERRPRPRWKTKLVEQQQLRWFRATLLGRIPAWTPTIAPVGPWRSIWAETASVLDVESLDVRAAVEAGDGVVHVDVVLRAVAEGAELRSVRLRVGDDAFDLEVERSGGAGSVRGTGRVRDAALWWPRTHGDQPLYPCGIDIDTSAGPVTIDCGPVGFRDIRLDGTGGGIRFLVNGVSVFCRGSCWTTNDAVSLVGDPDRMRRTLELLAEAHGNMIRVGGTMVYETDAFYRACDELGIMVWQDFMFANMDYPVDDRAFADTVRDEADQQLRRLSRHPAVVAYCGGSEVEQQAAMFGAPREIWSNALFAETLPSLVEAHAPGTPYWPSTPTGGALPFHVGEGLAHYYGVGAYRRPLDDVRVAGVKFAPECLGFSHVPDAENLRKLTAHGSVPPHHPAWKRGVPRDTGAGWDFEDVRDHYLARLYGVHAVELRSEDLERYLALSRVVTGEAMGHAFAEWRRGEDPCGGALTWFLNDLRPGSGWGLIDSDGAPKAAYHHLRRAWAPRCVRLLDRGLDGLVALLVNESEEPLEAELEVLVVARGGALVAEHSGCVTLAARSSREVGMEQALGHFLDSTYAYRFGPPRHEAIVARLVAGGEGVLSEDVYRPVRSVMTAAASSPLGSVRRESDDRLVLTLTSDSLLYDVRIDVRDHRPTDDHFCLTPGRPRAVPLVRTADSGRSFQGYVEALNLSDALRLAEPE